MSQKSVIDSYTPDELKAMVQDATYMKDVLKKIGLRDECTYNRRSLKKRLDEYGIDYSHFEENSRKQKEVFLKQGQNSRPLAEILVENSTYKDMNHLKNRLIRNGVLENQCRCGQKPIWKRKKLPLYLTLINNVSQDFRLENLVILCPNCRSQVISERTTLRNKKRGEKNRQMKAMKRDLARSVVNIESRKVKNRPSAAELLKMKEQDKMSFQAIGDLYGVTRSSVKKWFVSCGLK